MTNNEKDAKEQGLVICGISAREDTDNGFASPKEINHAAELFPERSEKPELGEDRYSITLTPGSIKVSRKLGSPPPKSENYKAKTSIKKWSKQSRSNMVAVLASLDYNPLFEFGYATPAMLTLTYPKSWEVVAPTAADTKRHMRLFRQRYERRFGRKLRGCWKLEWQARSAPHIHIFCVPPEVPEFRGWLSETWADIVNAPDPEEKKKHLKAGTGIDYGEGIKASDPKRLAVYFTKHGSANFGDKEYQNQPPELWVEDGSIGRLWGYYGLTAASATVEVDTADALFVARTLRRWQRAQAKPRRVKVWRTNSKTGEVRPRFVRRKKKYLKKRSGFMSVNDGSVMGEALARALAAYKGEVFSVRSEDQADALSPQTSLRHEPPQLLPAVKERLSRLLKP